MTVFLEYDLKKSFLLLSHTLLSPSCYFAVLLFRARHICNVLRLSKSFTNYYEKKEPVVPIADNGNGLGIVR